MTKHPMTSGSFENRMGQSRSAAPRVERDDLMVGRTLLVSWRCPRILPSLQQRQFERDNFVHRQPDRSGPRLLPASQSAEGNEAARAAADHCRVHHAFRGSSLSIKSNRIAVSVLVHRVAFRFGPLLTPPNNQPLCLSLFRLIINQT